MSAYMSEYVREKAYSKLGATDITRSQIHSDLRRSFLREQLELTKRREDNLT